MLKVRSNYGVWRLMEFWQRLWCYLHGLMMIIAAMPCPIYRVTPRIPQAQGILLNRQNQVQVGFNFFSCSSSNPHALRNDKTILNLEKSSLLGRPVSLSLVTWEIFTASPYISRIVLLLAQAGIPSCRPPFPHESGKHFPSQHGFRLSWNRNKKIRN